MDHMVNGTIESDDEDTDPHAQQILGEPFHLHRCTNENWTFDRPSSSHLARVLYPIYADCNTSCLNMICT